MQFNHKSLPVLRQRAHRPSSLPKLKQLGRIEFKEQHRNKLIIFISHAKGRLPKGRSGESVMFDASLKIYVEGYRAFSKGRFIGPKGYYDIWPEEAARYWGEASE